jgi:hypothetical protein
MRCYAFEVPQDRFIARPKWPWSSVPMQNVGRLFVYHWQGTEIELGVNPLVPRAASELMSNGSLVSS